MNLKFHSKFKWTLLLGFAGMILILLLTPPSQSQSANSVKTQDEEMRLYMVNISRQLNVTCTTCHNTTNFKSDDKLPFKVAKEHMKITQLLIDNGMDGKKSAKADCYMCHRGELKAAYKEPAHSLTK